MARYSSTARYDECDIKNEMDRINEYLISNAGALVKKTSMTQQAERAGNREVILEHEVYDNCKYIFMYHCFISDSVVVLNIYDLHCSSRCHPSHSCHNTTREMEMEDAGEMGDRHADISLFSTIHVRER